MFFASKILFSSIEYIGMIMLSLSAFRLQIRYYFHRIVIIALVMSFISTYIRDILNESAFAMVPMMIAEIVLIMILYRLPLLFSFLVSLAGNLATVLLEMIVVWLEINLHLVSPEKLQTNLIPIQLSVTALLLLLVTYLQRRKIGYHFTMRDSLKGYNFYLSAVLVIAVIIMLYAGYSFEKNTVNTMLPLSIAIIFLLYIFLSYSHNKRLWKERRNRLENRK